MEIIKEYDSANEFPFWAGAKYTYNRLNEIGLADELWGCIEQYFGDCGITPTETQVNDFVWFEDEILKEYIGFDFWIYDSKEEAEATYDEDEDEN